MLAGREAVVARTVLDTRAEAPAHAPWTALTRFARRKPLGAVGGLIVLALVLTAVLAPLISPYDPRQIIREAGNRVPVYVAPNPTYHGDGSRGTRHREPDHLRRPDLAVRRPRLSLDRGHRMVPRRHGRGLCRAADRPGRAARG